MKVLVTGGAGYIGSVTAKLLLDRGHEVAVLDNLEYGHLTAVDKRALFIEADLKDKDVTIDVIFQFRPEAVVHMAGYALVGESMKLPLRYMLNNVGGGLNLLEGMRIAGCDRIVFSSSCATYGNPKFLPITEAHPQEPVSPYGVSKLMFEQVLRTMAEMRYTSLRYFNACGADLKLGEDHDPETHLIANCCKAALKQIPYIVINGRSRPTSDGTCVRDYVDVGDIAWAHVLALEQNVVGEFNLGSGRGHSVLEVVTEVGQQAGVKVPTQDGPDRPGDPDVLIADYSKFIKLTGWRPTCGFEFSIDKALAWHRDHPNGYVEGT